MSALLHALAALTQTEFRLQPDRLPSSTGDEDNPLPVTSYACQWKPPRKRKESTLKMSDAVFQKHEYDKRKRPVSRVEDFDTHPVKYRGTAKDMLPALLSKVHGQGLCISTLHDPRSRYWCSESAMPFALEQPSLPTLKATVAAFKESLSMSQEQIDKLECETRNQRKSSTWFSARRYRLTSSMFGEILHRRNDTQPDALVLRILKPCKFSSAATD